MGTEDAAVKKVVERAEGEIEREINNVANENRKNASYINDNFSEFENNVVRHEYTNNEEPQQRKKYIPTFIRNKYFWLIVIFILVLFRGVFGIENVIDPFFTLVNDLLNQYILSFYVSWYLTAVKWALVLLGISFFYKWFFSKARDDEKAQWSFKALIFFAVVFTLLFFTQLYFYQPAEFEQDVGEALQEGEKNTISATTNFHCNFLAPIGFTLFSSLSKEDCEKLENEVETEVVEEQRISITPLDITRTQERLNSPEDGITFNYRFEVPTSIPVTLLHYECFRGKRKEAFFSSENFDVDKTFSAPRTVPVTCENLGKTMKETEEEKVDIYAKIYFSVENSFTHYFPVINCGTDKIEEIERSVGLQCSDYDWDLFKFHIDKTARDYNPVVRGGNAVSLSLNFAGKLPLKIGDGRNEEIELEISVKEKKDFGSAGQFVSGNVLEIDPSVYLDYAENQIIPSRTGPISLEADDEETVFVIDLVEQDAEEISGEHIFMPFTILTQTTHNEQSKTANVKLIANFEIQDETPETEKTQPEENSNTLIS